jgi:hypothetical protein
MRYLGSGIARGCAWGLIFGGALIALAMLVAVFLVGVFNGG